MAVYYKFKSAKESDSISIDSNFISILNLKQRIFDTKKLGCGTDFDLKVFNANTYEEYLDEQTLIPRNTSVVVSRDPGRRRSPIVTQQEETKTVEIKVDDVQSVEGSLNVALSSSMIYPEEAAWDEFGDDLYDIPEMLPQFLRTIPMQDAPPPSRADEDSKIKALVDLSALDWNQQTRDVFGAGRGSERGMGGRMMGGRDFARGMFESKIPPPGYICHRCKISGHLIQHCPTNGDPSFDIKRVKHPTGIPKSMLMATPDGHYTLPGGAVAVLKPNEAAFDKEVEGITTSLSFDDIPSEMQCPLCNKVMKDAMLTSKCCLNSFCDKCIRDLMLSKSQCVCGSTNVLADDLLPNKALRKAIDRILESSVSNNSGGNVGSVIHNPDLESALSAPQKPFSPALSAASEDQQRVPVSDNLIQVAQDTAIEKVNVSKCVPEKVSAKKVKKKKVELHNGAEMQLIPEEFAPENYIMPPSNYNPYWNGSPPFGIDGLNNPYYGGFLPMGYMASPFDAPFVGIYPQDPYASQRMPYVNPHGDFSELATSLNLNPLISLEEFEARKADVRRQRNSVELGRSSGNINNPNKRTRSNGGNDVSRPSDSQQLPRDKEIIPERLYNNSYQHDHHREDRETRREEAKIDKHRHSREQKPTRTAKKMVDYDELVWGTEQVPGGIKAVEEKSSTRHSKRRAEHNHHCS